MPSHRRGIRGGDELPYGEWLHRDGKLILLEKAVRTVPYGFLSVAFSVYLVALGFDLTAIGIVLTLTILSSAAYTFAMSFVADLWGRRKTLALFAMLDFVAGALLFSSTAWWAPVFAGIVGNMTVGAGEVGPFLSVEQAMLPQTCEPKRRTFAFSLYNFVGYGASAAGAGLASLAPTAAPDAVRPFFLMYMASGLVGAALFLRLSKHVESEAAATKRAVLSEPAQPIVYRLAGLFAIDSFGGGFIGGNILSLYFSERFGLQLSTLGLIFLGAQLITALSFFLATPIAKRIGLLPTMVFTHIPSNVFLIAVAFAPTAATSVFFLFCRQSLSQMDVPTRQSYVMAIVPEADRTPAAGFTSTTRTVTSSVSPSLAGYALENLWVGVPLVAAGTLKLVYDTLIYFSFRKVHPPEEQERRA